MSAGKKTLVVVDDLDRMILQDQLVGLGIDVEVIVDRSAAGKIVGALLTLPSRREEMQRVIGQTGYKGPYHEAASALADRIKEEVQKFTAIYPKSFAARDMLINLLSEELKPDIEPVVKLGVREDEYIGDYVEDTRRVIRRVNKELTAFCALHDFLALRGKIIESMTWAFTEGPESVGGRELKQSNDHQHPEPPVSKLEKACEAMTGMVSEMLKGVKDIRDTVVPMLTIKQTASVDESVEPAHLVEAFRFLQKNPEIFSRHLDQMLTEPPAPDNRRDPVNYLDVSLTLQRLAAQLSDEAGAKGISIDAVGLHAYLLTKSVTTKRDTPDPSTVSVKFAKGTAPGVIVGNHMFDWAERNDGSIRIVTVGEDDKTSVLILCKDGTIKLEKPGSYVPPQ